MKTLTDKLAAEARAFQAKRDAERERWHQEVRAIIKKQRLSEEETPLVMPMKEPEN